MASDILTRNNVKVFGSGTQPLVFAHGFGCDQNMWRYVTPAFEDDYRIVLFDYVGSGNSDMNSFDVERYSRLEGYARDVSEVLDALDLQEVTFIGHSVSGMIGSLASIDRPELFRKLVLLAPSPCYLNDSSGYRGGFERKDIDELLELMDMNYLGWASFLAPVVMQNSDNPKLAEELEQSFCSTDPVTAMAFAKATFLSDYRDRLPEITTPALIAQCSDDAIAPPEVGDYMHRHIPQSILHQMKANGHCPHVSHPEETIAVISDFLGPAPS